MADRQSNAPLSLQDILRYSVEQTAPADASVNASMDPERRNWLESALNNMTTNVIDQMKNAIKETNAILDRMDNESESDEDLIESIDNAIDTLIEYVGQIDAAADFCKINGLDVVARLLNSKSSVLQMKSAELLAELVQNHSFCQDAAIKMNFLDTLTELMDKSNNSAVRVKALFALSCLVRHNKEAQNIFDSKLDGFSVLLRILQSHEVKLRVKSSFLITALCREQRLYMDTLYKMGFVEQLVGLLNSEHDESHEHLLAALYELSSQHPPSLKECRRDELQLESLLRTRVDAIGNKDEYLEEKEYCRKLLELCFNKTSIPETDR